MGERAKRAPRSWRAVRPAVYPVARRERDAAPPGPPRKSSRGRAASLANQSNTTRPARRTAESRKSLRLGKSGANDDCVPSRSKRLAQHTARVRAAGFRASRRVRRVRDATPCPRRAVSPRGARRRFPPRRTRQSRTRHLVVLFFVILCACPGSSRERKRGGETRGPREPAPSSLTRPSSRPPPSLPP